MTPRKPKVHKPTRDQILERMDYIPEKGILVWNYKLRAGRQAGCLCRQGYVHLKIFKIRVRMHQVVWFLETGSWPDFIDHINGDRADNRFSNLRLSSPRENQQNKKVHRDGKLLGATWHKKTKKWRAQIRVKGKNISLGYFKTEEDASKAYMQKLIDLKLMDKQTQGKMG